MFPFCERDFAELRDNLSNIDVVWGSEVKELLRQRDFLFRALHVEMGIPGSAPPGWAWQESADYWLYVGPSTATVRPVVIRHAPGVWALCQTAQQTGGQLLFATALEAMLAEPPWDAIEDGETQEITLN